MSLTSPALEGGFFITSATWETHQGLETALLWRSTGLIETSLQASVQRASQEGTVSAESSPLDHQGILVLAQVAHFQGTENPWSKILFLLEILLTFHFSQTFLQPPYIADGLHTSYLSDFISYSTSKFTTIFGTSLAVQWLRRCLSLQGVRVQSLVRD